MNRPLLVAAVLVSSMLVGSARAQTCNMSGTWGSVPTLAFSIREDATGTLTGIFSSSSDASVASTISGSRTGTSFAFSISNGTSVAGTLTTCDTMTLSNPAGFTLPRISQTYCGNGVIEPNEEC